MSNFTIIEYTGRAAAPIPYFGKVTKTMYRFGGKVRRMAVNSLDAAGLLAIYEGQQPAFRLVNEELPIDEIPANPEPPTTPTEQTSDDAKAHGDKQPPDEPFDFTVLAGIGPARNQILHDACITTLQAFAETSNERIAELLNAGQKVVAAWKVAIHA